MELLLKRKYLSAGYTIGDLLINGKFFCNTIEDPVRRLPEKCPDTIKGRNCTCPEKIYSNTAIPAGTYKVTMQYSPRFKRPLPCLHNVPHFLGVLIHPGNTANDTAGCILPGSNTFKGKVTNSRTVSDKLNELLANEKCTTIRIWEATN